MHFGLEEDLFGFNLKTVPSSYNYYYLFQFLRARLHHLISSTMLSSALCDRLTSHHQWISSIIAVIWCHHHLILVPLVDQHYHWCQRCRLISSLNSTAIIELMSLSSILSSFDIVAVIIWYHEVFSLLAPLLCHLC